MTIRFETSEYENSHGKRPRGTGMWAFDIVASNGRGGHTVWRTFSPGNTKLGDAKRAARIQGQQQFPGYSLTIIILP